MDGNTQEDDEILDSCKIVLVGESGTGKTCIIDRYIYDRFKPNQQSTASNYVCKIISLKNDKKIRLDIWDTAGQEKFRSLNKFFYKDATIAIMVYDITQKSSFESIKEYWHNEIKSQVGDKIIFGLAGNKSDLYKTETVSENEARSYAQEIGAVFELTSSIENTGIDELFTKLVEKYYGCNHGDIDTGTKHKGGVQLNKKMNKNVKGKKCC